jgi:hypothetical protein
LGPYNCIYELHGRRAPNTIRVLYGVQNSARAFVAFTTRILLGAVVCRQLRGGLTMQAVRDQVVGVDVFFVPLPSVKHALEKHALEKHALGNTL